MLRSTRIKAKMIKINNRKNNKTKASISGILNHDLDISVKTSGALDAKK
jgi:hypothetical protein